MTRSKWLSSIVCAYGLAAAAVPARAAGVETAPLSTPPAAKEPPGITVQVDGFHVTARGLELDYAFFDRTGGLSGGGEVITLPAGSELIPRFSLLYRGRADDLPAVGASIWELRQGGSSETGEHPAKIGALMASPDFAIGRSLVDSALAEEDLRATQVDAGAEWTWGARERLTFGASVGLRLFRFERELFVRYDALRNGVRMKEFIQAKTDASGIGPRIAGNFDARFGCVRIGGRAGIAMAVGDRSGEVTDSAFLDGSFDRATVATRPGQRKAFTQFEGRLTARIEVAPRVDITAAWDWVLWPGVTVDDRFVDDVSQNSSFSTEGDLVLEGISLGVAVRF
jgi:hypothetical protein